MYTNYNYYYNPYMNNYPRMKKRFDIKKIDFNKILNGTSKTLNVINQAIPIYYQIKPIISNAKTLFKVANILKSEPVAETVAESVVANEVIKNTSSGPTFFL